MHAETDYARRLSCLPRDGTWIHAGVATRTRRCECYSVLVSYGRTPITPATSLDAPSSDWIVGTPLLLIDLGMLARLDIPEVGRQCPVHRVFVVYNHKTTSCVVVLHLFPRRSHDCQRLRIVQGRVPRRDLAYFRILVHHADSGARHAGDPSLCVAHVARCAPS